MIVCDSKQTAVLEHELRVLHSQLQPLPGPPGSRNGGACGAAEGGGGGRTSAAGGSPNSSSGRVSKHDDEPPEERDFCPFMPRYFGSFLSENEFDGQTRVSIVEEHVPGGDLGRWIDEGALNASCAADGGTGYRKAGDSDDAGQEAGVEQQRERVTWRSSTSSSMSTAYLSNSSNGHGQPGGLPTVLPLPPPEEWLARVCRDTLEALRHLHARRCIHRDVKPANILLHVSGGAKLADFGSSVQDEDGDGAHRMHGTIRFMSPERLWAKQCSPSSDLWSAGLTVAAAALGENPIPHCATEFEAVGHAEAAFEIVRAHPTATLLSDALMDFLKAVLVTEPDQRPTIEKMLQHRFVLQVAEVEGDTKGTGVGDGDLKAVGAVTTARVGPDTLSDVEFREGNAVHDVGGGGGQEGEGGGGCKRGRSDAVGCGKAGGKVCGDPLARLRNKRSDAANNPKDAIRRIVTARRARRSGRGVFKSFNRGSGGSCGSGCMAHAQSPSPLRELDISHLASVLQVTEAELRLLFSHVNAELDDESPDAPESSLDPSSASSSDSNSLSPLRTRSGDSEHSTTRSGSRRRSGLRVGVSKTMRVTPPRPPVAPGSSLASRQSSATSVQSRTELTPRAAPAATPITGPSGGLAAAIGPALPGRSNRFAGWHRGVENDRNSGSKSIRSSHRSGRASVGDGRVRGGGGPSRASGNGHWPLNSGSNASIPGPAGTIGGMWKNLQRLRFKPARHGPPPLVKNPSFNAKTRPPSGLDDSMELSSIGFSNVLDTPSVSRTDTLPFDRGEDERTFSGEISRPLRLVAGSGAVVDSPDSGGHVSSSVVSTSVAAPGWGTSDAFGNDEEAEFGPSELRRLGT